ncbi:hypothetical protein DFJ73DRAFT_805348 [Zopfochytrium polystomum]|nr:hypothetical protein DFJ73DRAFT_805348 [Zopfochytrium polystomum]
MPTVNVDKEHLFEALGRTFTTEEFEELCFEFGIELEEETSELEMAIKELGADKAKNLSSRSLYRIDIPANRYDLLCAEGITRALRIFLGAQQPPVYRVVKPPNGKRLQQLHVKPETAAIRPFVVAAVLRNITFTQASYDSFIDLQDKLHNNICRKRTLVAIGTHDLDTLEGPFSYEALPPDEIKFIPLNQTQSMTGAELMTFYESDRKLSKFLHIIREAPRYPIIYDSKRTVLSLPPIINSNHSKIKLTTKNVFIECTATDLTKAKIVLNTVVTMFSQYAKDKFSVEPVEIVQPNGDVHLYPDFTPRTVSTTSSYINSRVGVKLDIPTIITLLGKMGVSAKHGVGDTIEASIPPTRSDILHACDVMEDVAIAYGFNKIEETTPKANTPGAPFPINKLSDQVRRELALSGYTEVLPLILCSHDENFAHLKRVDDNKTAVKLANPKTVEYQVVRTSLLPGLLKTLSSNKKLPLPLKIFEVSDVVFKDDSIERRARNQRNLALMYANMKSSGFELVHGMLDRVMAMLNVPQVAPGTADGHYIKESTNATFFPGRRADVFYQNKIIGTFGIVHPEVINNFEFQYPTSALEINLEPFL